MASARRIARSPHAFAVAVVAIVAVAALAVPAVGLAADDPRPEPGLWTPWVVLFVWVSLASIAAVALHRSGRRREDAPANARTPAGPDPTAHACHEPLCRLQAAAIDAAGDPVTITNRDGRIVWVNEAFAGLTGYATAEVLGRDVWFANDDDATLRALVETVVRTGQTARGESRCRSGSGATMVHEYTLSPVSTDGGRVDHVVIVQHDVSEQRAAAVELRRAKDDADAANRAKSDTLAMVSHEVRTPLSGIIGLTDLALATPLSDTQREYLDMIESSAYVMLEVINDILDLSRIEAGRLDLDETPFALHECLEAKLVPLGIRAKGKGLALTCHIGADVPDRLVGDAQRFGQVLVNLVGNAIKFTDHGSVNVRVTLAGAADAARGRDASAVPASDGGVLLHLVVSDTGIGIPPEQQERIFDAFEQGDASRARCAGGTGLGLAIAMRLVHKMGGWMWVESSVGAGSAFHATFSFGLQAEQAAVCGLPPSLGAETQDGRDASAGPVAAVAPTRRVHVLLAEDDPIHERLVVAVLQQRGHAVIVAHTGTEVLRLLDTTPVDVVLMDVRMPEMDGLTATAEIRQRETSRLALDTPTSALRQAHMPIIAMTAAAMPLDRERCLAAGMDDYLTKPFGPAALLEKVEAAALRTRPATAAPGTVPHPPSPAVVDRDLLFDQLDDNVALLRDLARLFDERGPRLLDGIRTAIAARDADELQLLAHGLKGTLGNLAAHAGQAAACEVEECAARHDFQGAAAALPALEAEVARVPAALEAILKDGHPGAAAA